MWFAISFTTLIALKEYFIHNSLDLNWDHPLLIKWIYWTSINCNLCTIYSQYLISFHWKFAISTKYIKKKASNEIDPFKMIEYVVEALS